MSWMSLGEKIAALLWGNHGPKWGQDDLRIPAKIQRNSKTHGKFPYQQSEPNGIKPINFCLE